MNVPDSIEACRGMFRDEASCADYLARLRWPDGFVCPHCGVKSEPYRFAEYATLHRCRACRADTSLTAGTVMHRTKQPLPTWFLAAYIVSSQGSIAATEFQRQLGIKRYETAFDLLRKLRASMVPRGTIGGDHRVEVADAFVGREDASRVVAVVEVRDRIARSTGAIASHAGLVRLHHVESDDAIETFVAASAAEGTTILRDGNRTIAMAALDGVRQYLLDAHHGVGGQHLQGYLNEYAFRLNQRFGKVNPFASLLGIT